MRKEVMDSKRPVLLIDDYAIDQRAVKRVFNELQIINPLIIKSDGEEGLDYLRDQSCLNPSLILLDLNMPIMSGIEFLEIIKKDDRLKLIPVIIFTTSDEERDKIASYRYGVAGYIVKPPEVYKFKEILIKVDLYWSINEIPKL